MRPTQAPSANQQQAAEYELYKRIKLLGEGAFGKAYLVEDLRTHELLVQKQMDMKAMSTEEKRETQKEARILQQLNHPNIVKFKDVYTTKKGKLCIIMEYADGGDLAKVVKDARGKYLQEKQILDWFTQICLAMKHVHDRKIIHRDLKGQNIFLTRNHIVKLGDFGIARVLSKTVEKAKTMVGTPYYLSPEIIESKPYSFKTDIWSLGVILYELCALKPPFNADSLHFLALKIVKGQYSPIPTHFSKEMKNLVSNLLQVDAIRRPSINDIMKMPIIQERVKNFLSETIRQVEFSHTILHNKIIDAKVNLADIKMVNQEQPCPPHLIQQYMNKDQKDQNQQQKPQNPPPQQPPQQQQQAPQPQKGANFHYKPQQNPVQNYANNYRPQSARNDQVQNNNIQQQVAQDLERKKEMERLKLERDRLELEKKKEQERIRQEKEKLAYQKLEQEKEARYKRQKEQELKEKQREERERELQKIAFENKQRQLQLNQINQKREEVQAGGMAVFANPNFKPNKQPVVPVKNIQLPASKPSYNPPKSGGEKRNNSKPAVARSGSSHNQQNVSDKKVIQQKKDEEAKQKIMEQRIQRQKSEKEKKDYEMKLQKEKEEELLKKKEDKQKKIDEQREQMIKDRRKWQKGGEKQIEFVENKIGGSTPSSNNQLEKESDQDNTSNEQLEKKQKVPVKKWSVPQKVNNKKDDWDIQIFESKKKPTQAKQKSEDKLDEYNSDEENKQDKKLQKKQSKTEKDLDEYNSDSDDLNNRKADITAQEIPEDIEENVSKLPEIVREETYLQNEDNTEFNIVSEADPKQCLELMQQLQEIVENADKLQIDEKFARNDFFDFTKTQKTKKFNQPNKSKESLTTQEEEDEQEVIRDDDSDEPERLQNTGKFLDDFPEPPKLQPKQIAQDEQESINIIGNGHEKLEHLYIELEEKLSDNFTKAYKIMSEELKKLDYNLDLLEKKYGDNRYSQLLDFLSKDQIDKYLRIIITLVCLEQQLYNSN
ncbi:Serine/Threonine kinase domain protein (macronuclear) [Tetrahymena thermophila SB210]|uniref:non-specific serine/threonine protein kinase n=1 Tax=Tetrahymena thermophila (strain SB210) TaxID=312017 RepID=Q238Z8_TETTS|nr:Serine/Threonine kinase domain protein [Tetrahymena thermophila SB210]EAR93072.2 Serine/Threonine kinase domain protein [Tetrahymena thermophila SB210]|eukprot:XP_001013317.2 Serine/Threonine kinase domain protein [Tetrahymena thermophila SB210]